MRHLVVREEGPVIVIAPAEPNMIFVPVYNPGIVYGEWRDRRLSAGFHPPPPRFVLETIEPGFQVSVGYGIVAPLWGWSPPDWRGQRIAINRAEYTRITPNIVLAPGDAWRRGGPVVLAAPAVAARCLRQRRSRPARWLLPPPPRSSACRNARQASRR